MTVRKIIRFYDTTDYRGPTTMEELRAQTMQMTVRPEAPVDQTTYDRELIVGLLAQGMRGTEIAKATGASVSLVSRIKNGSR